MEAVGLRVDEGCEKDRDALPHPRHSVWNIPLGVLLKELFVSVEAETRVLTLMIHV